MNKLAGTLLIAALAGSAWAQGSFTIRRPVDGSTVRETVKVRIPLNSMTEGSYLGILINGKFVEAVIPKVDGADAVYELNTKEMRIPDGEMTLDVVLYQDGEPPVERDRSSIRLNVDNYTSITPGIEGKLLRYRFAANTERVYETKLEQEIRVGSSLTMGGNTGRQGTLMGREEERVRLAYAVHNTYAGASGREALISVQARPDKDKDYAWITASGETTPKKYYREDMAPWYMRMTDTGREVFSGIPLSAGLESSGASQSLVNLYAFIPMPVLPSEPVNTGDVWEGAMLDADGGVEKLAGERKFFGAPVPARATLQNFEWFQGRPCAKITMEVGQADVALTAFSGGAAEAAAGAQGNSLTLKETYFFDLTAGVVLHSVLEYTTTMAVAAPAGGTGGNTGGSGSGGRPGAGAAGGGGGGQSGELAEDNFNSPMMFPGSLNFMMDGNLFEFNPMFNNKGEVISIWQNRPGGGDGGPGGRGGDDGQGGGFGGGSRFGAGQAGNAAAGGARSGSRLMRISARITRTLEN